MQATTNFTVIIPARFQSSRLPGKPLIDLQGLPMIIRVANQAKKSNANDIIVATDNEKILQVCQQHNISAVITAENHNSGTDRIAEVISKKNLSDDDQIIVNVQGDEPLIAPENINLVAELLAADESAVMATLAYKISNWDAFANPNNVKVVCDKFANAIYFSRAQIPFPRDLMRLPKNEYTNLPLNFSVYHHIGLYAYKSKFVETFTKLEPSPLEICESLEQLRAIYHGYKIKVGIVNSAPAPGIDTPEDVEKVINLLNNRKDLF